MIRWLKYYVMIRSNQLKLVVTITLLRNTLWISVSTWLNLIPPYLCFVICSIEIVSLVDDSNFAVCSLSLIKGKEGGIWGCRFMFFEVLLRKTVFVITRLLLWLSGKVFPKLIYYNFPDMHLFHNLYSFLRSLNESIMDKPKTKFVSKPNWRNS